MVADKGIRVNVVAPGLVWTPLIPASSDPESIDPADDGTGEAREHERTMPDPEVPGA